MKELAQQVRTLTGIQLSSRQLRALELYERELLHWNEHINLTAIREPEQIRIKHFLDSLTCLMVMREAPPARIVDVGTGAGFPGLPLKIIYPAMQLTLVESVGKKAEFCRHVIQKLGLEGVQVIQDRVEVLGHLPEHRQQYDWALARAVAVMNVLVEYLLPFLRIGGKAIALKGETGPVETHDAEEAIQILGGRMARVLPVELPGVVETRYVVKVDKIAATPPEYPRRSGIPTKRPLS